MPIQILPPQLANQIAAGEVVERPASVVKELVENSLDAGASQIQIDIENGGASLIRIRDNGIGIPKAELSLALARHATSKISCLEDLEAILSLGFRGEALASISSVSRLTLTSRTAEQQEAWQVYVQGREQQSTIVPASHPVGTTVEVANLFFNTPARRKFLRTSKTEFAHIDEVIRRIALAKPQIGFTLSHNGKILRQYKSAVQNSQVLKRLSAICGEDFVQNALHIDWKHNDLHLSGWVATPNFNRPQNDLSYCYINGRMVKDKVITHAIRQAYNTQLNSEQYPCFVLFLDLSPNDVDVNVHPTKHEVRFQQSRLVHDFIVQGISNALLSSEQFDFSKDLLEKNQINETQISYQPQPKSNRTAAGDNIFATSHIKKTTNWHNSDSYQPNKSVYYPASKPQNISKVEQKAYAELLQTQADETHTNHQITQQPNILRALALVNDQAVLLQKEADFYLLPVLQLQKAQIELSLKHSNHQQPLLIPLVLRLSQTQLDHWLQQKSLFTQLGFDFVENLTQQRITLNKVPLCLRHQNLQKIICSLLNQQIEKLADFYTALLAEIEFHNIKVLADAVNLLQQFEQQINQQTEINLMDLLIKVDFNHYLN